MVLNENDMYNIIFKTIQQKPGEHTATTLMRNTCQAITDKVEGGIDTQEICDDVLNCFDYYNDFIKEKKLNLPIMGETYYNMVVVVLNALIGEILNEREKN